MNNLMPPQAPRAKFQTLGFSVAMQRINIFHYFFFEKASVDACMYAF